MSTEAIIKKINNFLSSDTTEVSCIRGEWGIGKTPDFVIFSLEKKPFVFKNKKLRKLGTTLF